MGVTIHFEGQLKSEAAYDQLITFASATAKRGGWRTQPIKDDEATLLRVRDEQDWDYTGPVKGIAVYLHEDCDPVYLQFDRDLYVQEYTKTQFAGADCHLKVIDFLRSVEPFFQELKVEDEAEYWETGDLATLQDHLDTVQRIIESELKKNPGAQWKVKTPAGRIVDLIT